VVCFFACFLSTGKRKHRDTAARWELGAGEGKSRATVGKLIGLLYHPPDSPALLRAAPFCTPLA
jgi:hypothetical protein